MCSCPATAQPALSESAKQKALLRGRLIVSGSGSNLISEIARDSVMIEI
jgi:hypothetical protein